MIRLEFFVYFFFEGNNIINDFNIFQKEKWFNFFLIWVVWLESFEKGNIYFF